MTELERDEDLADSIQNNKVSCAKGFKDVWDNQNWTRSSSKKEHEKEVTLPVNYHELKMIHGR
jgi:hypothetical protein